MKLSMINKWLSTIAILAGAAGLILALCGRWFAPFDIFAHFTPHLAGMALSGCLAYIYHRRAMLILLLGAIATLIAHPFIAWQGAGPSAAQAGLSKEITPMVRPASLKIISLNSWHSHPNPENIDSFVKAQNADIVILLEFGPNKRKLLEELRNEYPFRAHCADRWYCSVAILSKFPIKAHASGGPKTNIPAHVWITVEQQGQDLTIIGTHLHRPLDGMNRHRRQLQGLAKLTRKFSGAVLIAGDFNTTIWADSFRLFKHQSGLAHMRNYLPSWPAPFPQLAIDHLFHNEKLFILEAQTGADIGSDHLPLIAKVTVNRD